MILSNKPFPTFVINLPDDIEKKIRLKKQLNKLNLNYFFIDAVDGRNKNIKEFKNYNDKKRKLFFGRSLLPKELAILESHKLIFKQIVKENLDLALILEDDISFDQNFMFYLKKIVNLNYPWEIVRFIHSDKLTISNGRKVINLGNNYFLKRFPKLFGGAHAYLISNKGAKKILSQINSYYYPIDIMMGETWKNNLNSLICSPGLVWQETEYNIDPPGSIRFLKKEKKIFSLYPYTRLFFKIYETIAKWSHYLYKFIPDKKSLKNTKI